MTTSLPPRPRRQDREVVMAAAHQIASRLDIWCKRHGVSNDADMIASCCDEDGYRLARNLEQAGWPADEKLTDMLSGTAQRALDDAYTKAVREWVAANAIKVPFRIMDRVALSWCAKGQVIDIDHTTATVTVHPENEAQRWRGERDCGWVVGFEEAIPFAATVGGASQ